MAGTSSDRVPHPQLLLVWELNAIKNLIRNHGQAALIFLTINFGVAGLLGYAMLAPASSVKGLLLPGKTTHGHYQIELDCYACHNSDMTFAQDACIRCHSEELKLAKDTHPASKFNDPVNADLLQVLDVQDCLTCHTEHRPELTHSMGVSLPLDYCWHCHQDIAQTRPSHEGMAFDSCATIGCHNYHDNTSLYEKYLDSHYGEPELLEATGVSAKDFAVAWKKKHPDRTQLNLDQADHGLETTEEDETGIALIVEEWSTTAHAASGVNCSDCHQTALEGFATEEVPWNDQVSLETCGKCHPGEAETFQLGRHGMRLAAGMSPMQPSMARLSMHADASHRELTCNACHSDHDFNSQKAAVDACLGCHNDPHSNSYGQSSHAELWRLELAGELPVGQGVSCATCHMPRTIVDGHVFVNHNQSASLRPIEKMIRSVCANCHGLQFSLDALADPNLSLNCYSTSPETRVESIEMAHRWFLEKESKRQARVP